MMATTHLPSIVQAAFGPSFDHSLKTDKLFNTDDHEYEISKWLKLENDPLLSGPNSFADLGSDALLSNSVTYTTTANSQAAIQDFPANYFTSTAYTFSAPTSIVNNSSSPQLPPPLPSPQFVGSNNRQLPQPLPQTYTYTITPVPQTTQQFSTQYTPSFQTLQYAQPFTTTQFTSQFAPAYSSTQTQYTYTTTTPQYEASNPQYIQIATNPQYATQTNSVVPSQLFQQQYNGSSPASESQNSLPPQFQYVYQYPVVNKNSIVTSQVAVGTSATS